MEKSKLQLRRNKIDNFTSKEEAIEALSGKVETCSDGEIVAVRYYIDEDKTEIRTILGVCNIIDDETKTVSIFEDTKELTERIKKLENFIENNYVSYTQI